MPSLRAETWRAMEEALEAGKCRAIGVSNFTASHLRELKKTARVMPMVNQVEFHPYHAQRELLAFCREEGIVLQAYASLGGQGRNSIAQFDFLIEFASSTLAVPLATICTSKTQVKIQLKSQFEISN